MPQFSVGIFVPLVVFQLYQPVFAAYVSAFAEPVTAANGMVYDV